MKFQEFKSLSTDEQIELLTNRLNEIKGLKGRMDENFKNEIFEFDLSNIRKSPELGYKVANYAVHKIDEPVVKSKQKNVKEQKVVKQKQSVVKDENIELTKDEIMFVKELFKNKQDFVKTKQTLFVPQMLGDKKTTGISVYVELWERWGKFKKKHQMYSGTDLLALALEEFMEKYDEE